MMKPVAALGQIGRKNVLVCLKGNREYRGVLVEYDQHMNLVLVNASEYYCGGLIRNHDTVIVRGDNVIYISP